jgi:hypothetical protein
LTFTLDEDELEDKLLDETLPDSLVALFDIIAAAISAPIKLHLLTSSVELISKLLIRTEAGDMFVNDDKVAEVSSAYWNCPCVPMRERKECHCMLFLTKDNEFSSEQQEISVQQILSFTSKN